MSKRLPVLAIVMAFTVFVVPWLAFALSGGARPAQNIVAIPADGPGLAAPASTEFSRAPFFVLVDVASSRTRTVANSGRSPDALGIRAAHGLLREGAGTVVVRSARRDALNALTTQGAQVFAAPAGSVGDVLQRLLQGGLVPLRAAPAGEERPGSRAEVERTLGPEWAGAGPRSAMNARGGLIPGLGLQVVSTPRGLQVVSVAPNSSAQRAGIDRGDLILAVNRAFLADPAQLQTLAPGMPPFWALVERRGMRAELWIVP